MARSKTDGMSAANNQTLTAGMIESAKGRGLTEVWQSQETPTRPPMLPNYGAVLNWNFDAATKVKLRPLPPPALNSPEFAKALDELKAINKSQTREQARIANYWADGAGSYTPPGHWMRTAANAANEAKSSEVRMARTLALVGTALMDAGVAAGIPRCFTIIPVRSNLA